MVKIVRPNYRIKKEKNKYYGKLPQVTVCDIKTCVLDSYKLITHGNFQRLRSYCQIKKSIWEITYGRSLNIKTSVWTHTNLSPMEITKGLRSYGQIKKKTIMGKYLRMFMFKVLCKNVYVRGFVTKPLI